MRVPKPGMARLAEKNLASVQAEIAHEKAASLGRAGTKLREAMERLEAGEGERAALVAAAGQALWYYVVQREACGLRDTESVLREFRVSREVYLRMGMAPRP